MLNKIKHVTEWIPLSTIPSTEGSGKSHRSSVVAFWENLYKNYHNGVYQVSLTKPTALVSKDIGYIGQSGNLPNRVYNIRSGAKANGKTTHHSCGVYLRYCNVKLDEVYVRMIFVAPRHKNDLEKFLHKEHRSNFGYDIGYAWEEASGGWRASRINAMSAMDRCDEAKLLKLQKYLDKLLRKMQESK